MARSIVPKTQLQRKTLRSGFRMRNCIFEYSSFIVRGKLQKFIRKF